MHRKLAHLFTRKLVIAALAAALVAVVGTTAALAAAGAQQGAPRVTQGQSSQARSQAGTDDNSHSSGASQNSQHIEGAISSVDASNSSFVVASEHSGNVTVVVGAGTAFDDGVSGFADLKVGMFVEVNGNFRTDNTLTATRIERGDDTSSADDRHDGGSGGPGHGGHDDGVPHQ